jgi:predicted nucleic acid-binding protein
MKIYVDTNIFLDFIQQRKHKYKDFSEYARLIFIRSLSCEFEIVISNITIFELNKVASTHFLKSLKPKLICVQCTTQHKNYAQKIPIHFPDNLHCALAILENCDYIISNDREMLSLKLDIPIISSQDL